MPLSLSDTYAPGAVYAPFYPFGGGAGRGFLNSAMDGEPLTLNPVFSDPLATVAGDDVDIVTFASAGGADTRGRLRECFGVPYPDPARLRLIPSLRSSSETELDAHIIGHLRAVTRDRTLLVSQPFFDPALEERYRIDPRLSHWLNDKSNLPAYVPVEHLPRRLATYQDGSAFRADTRIFCPAVAKLASSSGGQGVRIIRVPADLAAAREVFGASADPVFLEEYIEDGRNLGIQFAIPADPQEPPRLVGAARQVVDREGSYIGNRIERDYAVPPLIADRFLQEILPRVRSLGWHGVGGMDVIDQGERFFCIDPNFRVTGSTAHLYHRASGLVRSPALTFYGEMSAPLSSLAPHARMGDAAQRLYVLAAHEEAGETALIGGALYEDDADLADNLRFLRELGIRSHSFTAPESLSPSFR